MQHFICTTCGVQYSKSKEAPLFCLICKEERQFVNPLGQTWTTLGELQQNADYTNEIVKKRRRIIFQYYDKTKVCYRTECVSLTK